MDTGGTGRGGRRGNRRSGKFFPWRNAGTWRLLIVVLAAAAVWGWWEMRNSALQARLFTALAQRLSFHVAPGANPGLWLPHSGPCDIRLGYSRMKDTLPRPL